MAAELFDHLHLPGKSDRTLVLLHGSGGDKETIATVGRRIDPDATLLALNGQVLQNGERRFFKRQTMGLFDRADLAARGRDLVAFLDASFARLKIDPAMAAAVGYSNGASLLTYLVLSGTNPLKRSVVMHPLIPFMVEEWPDLSGYEVLMTSGALDPVCPAPWTEKLADGLREAGVALTLKMHKGGHELADEEIDWARDFLG